jgi:ABC-type bacteriocin/lantibiotic exporter with double-glycine peptidase domain
MTLARGANQLIGMKPSLKRAEPILKTLPETAPNAKAPGELSGAIEVSNVAFSHEGGVKVFDSVSFRVSPGSFVGIVGPSGCGKSTLMALLVGFEKPQNGAILYDGKDLSGLELSYVRKQIGMVRQNGRLFAGSLLENILGAKKGNIKDAWQAAELSGIASDIRALPMGMHTVVTEGAAAFSGGQVQRILLARALVGRPKLLMLDEATSALDNVSQAAIAENVNSLGATRIVVAHRLSSIRNADIIMFIADGRVQETGTYDELIERGGQFAEFAARQSI